MTKLTPRHYRLTDATITFIDEQSRLTGVKKAGIIEAAIRHYAAHLASSAPGGDLETITRALIEIRDALRDQPHAASAPAPTPATSPAAAAALNNLNF